MFKISKNLDQWIFEAEKYSSLCYQKYSTTWLDYKYPLSTREYYSKVSKNYYNLLLVLRHIKKYGVGNISCNKFNLINRGMCRECHDDQNHVNLINSVYDTYHKWINQALWNCS